MFIETDSLCLKQECITKFHGNIITASHVAMEQHIPKAKVIPGCDIEMDRARDQWRSEGNCARGQI